MIVFDSSIERNCKSCGEPFLVFNNDLAHYGKNGCLCGLCAKKERSELHHMSVIVLNVESETACNHCDRKLTPKDNIYLHDQEKTPFVLCEDCDRNLESRKTHFCGDADQNPLLQRHLKVY